MKKVAIMSITLISSISMVACGQEQEVPFEVKQAFEARFSNAENVEWEKENEHEWEAEFKSKGKEYSANFSAQGEWMETEYEIPVGKLPQNIKDALAKLYNDFDIEEAEVVESKEYGTAYELKVENDDNEIMVLFDKNGKVIQQNNSEDGDED